MRRIRKIIRFKKKAARLRRLHRHPVAVPILTVLVLGLFTGAILLQPGNTTLKNTSDTHIIILKHDKKQQSLPTHADTVGEFLKKAGITMGEGDVVEPSADTHIVDDNLRINVYRAQPIVIIDAGRKVYALSAATTPRSIAQQAGVTVYPEDNLNARPTEDFLRDQTVAQQVTVERATPAYINLYGTPVPVRTHAKTVGEVLKEKQIKLVGTDTLTPAPDTPLTANTQIFVTRFGTQIVTEEVTIPTPTQTVEDASLTFGTTAVRQAGSPGKRLVTYQLDLQNGKEVGRHKIQEVNQTEPVPQIIARGRAIDIPADHTALMVAAGISSADYPYVNYIVSRESGWCSTKLQGQVGYCPGYAPASIPSGLGYGLCQSTPGSKMASAGGDWQTNPVTQLRWCSGYASRYGGWAGSYNHWVAYHNW